MKTLKQTTRDNIKLDEKELDKELAEKMINPYFFTDEILKIGSKINLQSLILIMQILSYPLYKFIQISEMKQDIVIKS